MASLFGKESYMSKIEHVNFLQVQVYDRDTVISLLCFDELDQIIHQLEWGKKNNYFVKIFDIPVQSFIQIYST